MRRDGARDMDRDMGRARGASSRRRVTRRAVTAVAAAAAVAAVAGLTTGCSSHDSDSARSEKWRHNYCSALGSWQNERNEAAGDTGFAGVTVVAEAKRLHQEGLDRDGSHILDDTTMAVGGDAAAEGRAASYCDTSGFETLVKAG